MLKMQHPKRSLGTRTTLLALAAAVSVAGCVVAPAPGGLYVGPAYAPPPPTREFVGVAPAPGYVWSGGYYSWVGGRYVWVGGRWIAPHPGHVWVQAHWARRSGGWRFVEGHWR